MARPTIYNEEYITKTKEYINSCIDDMEAKKVSLPSIEGLAVYLDINKDTVYEWCKDNKEFSDVIQQVRDLQATRLINNGLAGTYNATITKLILGKHGYRESSETDVTTGGDKISIGIINYGKDNSSI